MYSTRPVGIVYVVFPHHKTNFPAVGKGYSTLAALAVEFLYSFGVWSGV